MGKLWNVKLLFKGLAFHDLYIRQVITEGPFSMVVVLNCGEILLPRGHLPMSGNIFGYHCWEGAPGI